MPGPNRGEVWLVDMGYAAKLRPCLVVSISAGDEDRALTTLVPHTTSLRNSRFGVKLKIRFLREGGFDAQNLVTIPHAKLIRKLGLLTDSQMSEVEDRLNFGWDYKNYLVGVKI